MTLEPYFIEIIDGFPTLLRRSSPDGTGENYLVARFRSMREAIVARTEGNKFAEYFVDDW